MLNCPPMVVSLSYNVTVCPICAAVIAKAQPAGPAPTTPIFNRWLVGNSWMTNSVSWQAMGLTKQLATLPTNTWSKQAWLQPIQVLISSSLLSRDFCNRYGSAKNGRAILTMSAECDDKILSAVVGWLIRFVATNGIVTTFASFNALVVNANAPRGTDVAMVGTRASCHPIPVLMIVAPARSISCANSIHSSWNNNPFSTKSNNDKRNIMIKSLPTAARVCSMISMGNRARFCKDDPPYTSVRWFVWGDKNCDNKYPSLPIISTPSYPAFLANTAVVTKSWIVLCTWDELNDLALKGEMGDLVLLADTANGWYPYRPVCNICKQIRAGTDDNRCGLCVWCCCCCCCCSSIVLLPVLVLLTALSGTIGTCTECTACVTMIWCFISLSDVNCELNGEVHPWWLGDIPPVTIKPTPPIARVWKYLAMRCNGSSSWVSWWLELLLERNKTADINGGTEWCSNPVCILPINTRLGNIPISSPKFNGVNK